MSSCCAEPRAQGALVTVTFPALGGAEPDPLILPLPPWASVSQLENPFGEQSKTHTSLPAALSQGQEGGKQEFLLSP